MRPCDCKDQNTTDKLDHQGLILNGNSITLRPNVVILNIGPCEMKINQKTFERFARWYFEDQDINKKGG